ncbi:MAG: hypothetical protein ACO1QB_13270 [Verrucomicrobiales bacterium]
MIMTKMCMLPVFAALVATSTVYAASDWQALSPYPTPSPLASVTFGEGKFVAGGSAGLIYSEDNGVTWVDVEGEPKAAYTAVAYANGRFVAVTSGNQIAVSEDGQTWTGHQLESDDGLLTVNYGNSIFVATGNNGLVASSPDGTNWQEHDVNTSVNLPMAAFGNNRFLVVATDPPAMDRHLNPRFLTSTNGVTWTPFTANLGSETSAILGLTFNGTEFALETLVINHRFGFWSTKTLVSADGVTWQTISEGGSAHEILAPTGNLLTYLNGNYVFFPKRGVNAAAHYSADGETWHAFSLPPNSIPLFSMVPSVAHGNDTYIVVGSSWEEPGTGPFILRGPSLNNLNRIDGPIFRPSLSGVAANGSTIVAVSSGKVLDEGASFPAPFLVSTNSGETFSRVNLPADTIPFGSGGPRAIFYGQEKFVAVGPNGVVLRSQDGLTWSKRLSNTTSHLSDIIFANGLWVAVGAEGKIITSSDASIFQLRPSGTDLLLSAVAFGNGEFIAVGNSGLILRSPDGVNWSMQVTDEGKDLLGIAHGNGVWVAIAAGGLVYASATGSDWVAQSSTGGDWSSVAFANGKFVSTLPGTHETFTSADGVHWTPSPAEQVVSAADSSDGHLWVVGTAGYIAHYQPQEQEQIELIAHLNSTGKIAFSFNTQPNGVYKLETTTDLKNPSWETADTLTSTGSTLTWFDRATPVGNRFYRVIRN